MPARINSNGTDRQDLIDQQHEVYLAASALLDALRKAVPHGRDYQTMSNPAAALSSDRGVYSAALTDATRIKKQAGELAINYSDQGA